MDLNQKDIKELQEKLILIYGYIRRERMYESFFFSGSNLKESFKTKNNLINKLLDMEDPEEFLETCVIELEELKTDKSSNIEFNEILNGVNNEELYLKYGMKSPDDVAKLDINNLIELC